MTLFDEFSEDNGGTLYIPKSHLRRERPNRNGYEEEQKLMKGKRGPLYYLTVEYGTKGVLRLTKEDGDRPL